MGLGRSIRMCKLKPGDIVRPNNLYNDEVSLYRNQYPQSLEPKLRREIHVMNRNESGLVICCMQTNVMLQKDQLYEVFVLSNFCLGWTWEYRLEKC